MIVAALLISSGCTPEAGVDSSSLPGRRPTDSGDTVGADADPDSDVDSDTGTGPVDTDTGAQSGTDPDAMTTAWGTRMVRIRSGTFVMGSGAADPGADYQDHEVTLTQDFWIGLTEVTREQWESDANHAGWGYGGASEYPCTTATSEGACPADTVSWVDAAKYANALSTAEGLTPCYSSDGTDLDVAWLGNPYACPGYRLPTEAEWEYAARAGEDTKYAGSDTSRIVAWTFKTAYSLGTYAHEASTLGPNAWGTSDMSGNVTEWTGDWYDRDFEGFGDGSSGVDPSGPLTGSGEGYEGSFRVERGGSWFQDAQYATVAYRSFSFPTVAEAYSGFRLARSIGR